MPHYVTTRTVRHTPEQMFDLVADVERYPEFVPMCESLKVRRRTVGVNGSEVLIADMAIGYKMIRESFTSRVALDRRTSRSSSSMSTVPSATSRTAGASCRGRAAATSCSTSITPSAPACSRCSRAPSSTRWCARWSRPSRRAPRRSTAMIARRFLAASACWTIALRGDLRGSWFRRTGCRWRRRSS